MRGEAGKRGKGEREKERLLGPFVSIFFFF